MDSQRTFTNPEPPLELVLEKQSTPLNTKLLVDGMPRYRVSTLDRDGMITNVTDLRTDTIIATVRRRNIFTDKVKFPNRFGGKSVKKDAWMMETKLQNGRDAWIIQSESGRFLWRWDAALRCVLAAENAPDNIIAFVKDEPPLFAYVVDRAAEASLDEIILAFTLLEHKLRMGTKSLRVADGWGADERAVLGHTVDTGPRSIMPS